MNSRKRIRDFLTAHHAVRVTPEMLSMFVLIYPSVHKYKFKYAVYHKGQLIQLYSRHYLLTCDLSLAGQGLEELIHGGNQ